MEEQSKNWSYNPYASEPIKHFSDLSRSEIDKLMVKIKLDKEMKQRKIEELKEKNELKKQGVGKVSEKVAPEKEEEKSKDAT